MGVASERMEKTGAQRRKGRLCRCCGKNMSPTCLWVCHDCQEKGRGKQIAPPTLNGAELRQVAEARADAMINPLEGMSIDEISCLAWEYRALGYGSYGKLRGYVEVTGKLPGVGR